MNNSAKLFGAGIAFAFVALLLAVQVGGGDYIGAAVAAVIVLVFVMIITIGKGMALDAVTMCAGVGGFYVLGKGFAYQNLGGLLFAGEALLAIGLVSYLYRWTKGRIALVPPSPLAIALLVLGIYGFLRLPYDYSNFQLMALRDACIIYYTLFFFVAYGVSQLDGVNQSSTRTLILLAVPGALVNIVNTLAPEFVLRIAQASSIGSRVFFLPHDDAIHPAMMGLVLYGIGAARYRTNAWVLKALFGFAVFGFMLYGGRGANFVMVFVVGAFLIVARQTRGLLMLGGGVLAVVAILLTVLQFAPSFGKGKLRQLQNQLEVIVAPSRGLKSGSQDADTVEWRLFWWKKIAKDVTATAPVFGFGFGADISSDFHKQYWRTPFVPETVQRTRGAHNAFFSVLARMGWLGSLAFFAVVLVQLRYFRMAAQFMRDGRLGPDQWFLWGSNLGGFTITFFQYAWEAPYSAIPYWVCMGLSVAHLDRLNRESRLQAPDRESEDTGNAVAAIKGLAA